MQDDLLKILYQEYKTNGLNPEPNKFSIFLIYTTRKDIPAKETSKLMT